MKIFTQILVACLFSEIMFAQHINTALSTPNTWTQKADFGGADRGYAVGFSINGKGYLGTGGKYPDPPYKDFWEYDPVTDTWTQKADFAGTARMYAVAFSIGSKGYLGTGYNDGTVYKDFWEYDPTTNLWTQKADFGGPPRSFAIGFSIGNKGYLGTGSNYPYYYKDFWEYDPAGDKWTQKKDFGGDARAYAVGFSIDNKGYLGTGYTYPSYYKDFWEYDPANDAWTQKADFGGNSRAYAVGFSIGGKGYLGTGDISISSYPSKDFWEYDPATNNWSQKADFGGAARGYAVGFSINSKGYLGTGDISASPYHAKDFWEYTPGNNCPAPTDLKVLRVSDTYAILKWDDIGGGVLKLQVRYRTLNETSWTKQRRNPDHNWMYINKLIPNTTYRWQLRSLCAEDTSGWIAGPNFTTTSSVVLSGISGDLNYKAAESFAIQITPNPNKGNFTIHLQLPAKDALTTLTLYNSFGERIWQQAGMLSGTVTKNIVLDNKPATGIYVLYIERSDMILTQKIVISK
ncbi:T9SS type A sorting domain-containing protein [Panacibacter ginsenosidivorans]|uniref:T9SS type A sorting domain-containing protein n=1 Tax=Panacibacter ginsenosidivorans TaxID=1813871 RepID=A0A5B8V5Z5_9BACT|nr:kelch repeat-containing protein [Panacibacter ginsenosidivorans]QEC66907.1 T9SS type A sorting domain-containing protein [Panacibacter ginsenosidivorans]